MLTIATLPRDDPYGTFDYCAAEGPGLWFGTAAESRGLLGRPVTREAFANLYQGLAEDGRRRLGRTRPFPGWWLVFTGPKTCAIKKLVEPKSARGIDAADLAALRAALGFIEDRCAWSRRGAQGKRLEKGKGLLFPMFPHELTRAGQLGPHWQGAFLNSVERFDGTWGALAGIRSTAAARDRNGSHGSGHRNPIFALKMEAGKLYRDVLRRELEARGFKTRDREKFGFELADVDPRLIAHFSKRRAEVLEKARHLRAELERKGQRVPNEQKLLQWAARSSRDAKPAQIDLAALRERWRKEALEILSHEPGPERAAAERGTPRRERSR